MNELKDQIEYARQSMARDVEALEKAEHNEVRKILARRIESAAYQITAICRRIDDELSARQYEAQQ